ncbi:MAG: hypothetical protein ABIC36_02675 [bacterium]
MKNIMEFIKNNLTTGLLFLSAIFNLYQYLLNRKLKKYSTKKKLKQRKAELEKLESDYFLSFGSAWGSFYGSDAKKEENEFNYKKSWIEAEIGYLEEILKMKNK